MIRTIDADWQFINGGDGIQFTADCGKCGRMITHELYGPDPQQVVCRCGTIWVFRLMFVSDSDNEDEQDDA